MLINFINFTTNYLISMQFNFFTISFDNIDLGVNYSDISSINSMPKNSSWTEDLDKGPINPEVYANLMEVNQHLSKYDSLTRSTLNKRTHLETYRRETSQLLESMERLNNSLDHITLARMMNMPYFEFLGRYEGPILQYYKNIVMFKDSTMRLT